MRLNESIVISAPPKRVWNYLAEPSNYLHFMSGITRWEVADDKRSGLGPGSGCSTRWARLGGGGRLGSASGRGGGARRGARWPGFARAGPGALRREDEG